MADSRWTRGRVAHVLGRMTRGAILSVGALTVAGLAGATFISKQAGRQKLKLPKDMVLMMDFEGSSIVEKAEADPFAKLRSDGEQLQLSKIVKALQHAGSDKRVQGIVACFGDTQQYVALAQAQELRNAIFDFRQAKADSVPTIAYSDSFGEAGGNGTVSYYLASAFDQIYVHETGLVSFTGFTASTPFLRGLLDKWHIKPLAFAREEYKSVVSQFTDKAYSKANREATEALLNGWMGQIVHDIAAARGLTPKDVVRALHASPLSAEEAAAAGLITAPAHRSIATHTLLHSETSAANPAALLDKQTQNLTDANLASKVLSAADESDSKQRTATSSGPVERVVQLATEQQSSAKGAHASLAQSSAANDELPSDIVMDPAQLADSPQQPGTADADTKQQTDEPSKWEGSATVGRSSLLEHLQAADKPLHKTLVVQISPDKLKAKLCPAVSMSKYIQVIDHEEGQNAKKPSIMQAIWAAITTADDSGQAESADSSPAEGAKPQVAVITASGAISAGKASPSAFNKQTQITSTDLGRDLRKARHDPKVKAVVLRVDSPGGSAVGSDAIYQEVIKVQRAGKPVVVSMGNLAASGGYYISAAANKIVAQPGTITGSIGVAFGKFNVCQALQDQGISVDTISVGRNATSLSLFHDFTKEQQRRVNATIDRTYRQFLSRVALGRNMSMHEARKVAKGRIWTGEDALHHGLVDKLGGLSDAVHIAKQEAGLPLDADKVDVVDFPPAKSVFELLRKAVGGESLSLSAADLAALQPIAGQNPMMAFWWLALARQLGLDKAYAMPGFAGGTTSGTGVQLLQHSTVLSGMSAHAEQQSGLQMLCSPVFVR